MAAVFTVFGVVLYIVGDAQTALDCSYRESVYQDGSEEMYTMRLECPQTDYVIGCGTRAALVDSHFLYKDNDQSNTSRRAAGLYGAPDSVNHLSS